MYFADQGPLLADISKTDFKYEINTQFVYSRGISYKRFKFLVQLNPKN